jgi:hypothetical protein
MMTTRRALLLSGLIGGVTAKLSAAFAQSVAPAQTVACLMRQSEFSLENTDSPFYEHFHHLSIPTQALIKPPAEGIVVKTQPVDQGSYDVEGFNKFIASSGLKAEVLRKHDHEVKISRDQLERIAAGEKAVEIRVISKAGNYVHNFIVTAPPSALAKVRKFRT